MTEKIKIKDWNQREILKDFKKPTYDEWKQKAVESLKGAPFEKKLFTKTPEGITLEPIYDKNALKNLLHVEAFSKNKVSLPGVLNRKKWLVAQEYDYTSAKKVNAALKSDIKKGVDMPVIIPGRALKSGNKPDFKMLFKDIFSTQLMFVIRAGAYGALVTQLFSQYLENKNIKPKKISGTIEIDPLSVGSRNLANLEFDRLYDEMTGCLTSFKADAPGFITVGVNASKYGDEGADAALEIALAIGTAVQYLKELSNRGIDLDYLVSRMKFVFSMGSDFFMQIAKLRAARLLWMQVVDSVVDNASELKMFIHAKSTSWNKTVLEPHLNILRSAVETFSAVVGGADSIHTAYFDELSNEPEEFSRRIARNTQFILQKESLMHKVKDPARGSYFVEKLTDELARKSWEIFKKIEKRGGFQKAVTDGFVTEALKESYNLKMRNIKKRKSVMVGVNMFATDKDFSKDLKNCRDNKRGAKIYEQLRRSAYEIERKTGRQPGIFLANLGSVKQHKIRADFARTFFLPAGFKVIENDGFSSPAKAALAAFDSGVEFTVICGTDKDYVEAVPAFSGELKKINAKLTVILAGYPKDMVDKYKACGVDEFIYMGADNYEILRRLLMLAGGEK